MIKTALQIKTIGSILKEKRKEKQLELKQVSDIIKIRVDYLQALEDGNYTVFPSEVYLKGFLKNYAKYVGVNTEKALALYRRENERKMNEATINAVSKISPKATVINFTPNKLIAMIAGIAILLILAYLGSYVGKVVRVPKLELTSPIALASESEGSYKTDANFIEISGSAEIGSKLTINDQELKLNNFEKFTREFPLEEGLNKFVIKAESQFGRTKELTLTISKEAVVITPTPTAIPTPLSLQLSIEVLRRDANITVSIDGTERTDRLYRVGSTLEFTANEEITLTTNQPASLSASLNGQQQTITAETSKWSIVDGEIVKE